MKAMSVSTCVCITMMLVLMSHSPHVEAQTPLPPCTGSQCNTLDPTTKTAQGYSCASPPAGFAVANVRNAITPVTGQIGMATVLRYSTWCQAYWTYGYFFTDTTANIPSSWFLDVQLTSNDINRTTIVHQGISSVTAPIGALDGFTNMYTGALESCVALQVPGVPSARVCTNQPHVALLSTTVTGTVGTDCNHPAANPGSPIWRFQITGLPVGASRVKQFISADGLGLWKNVSYYPCIAPFRWPLVDNQIMIGQQSVGVYFDFVGFPGAAPTIGNTYTAEVLDSLNHTENLTYP
jgi:hypothetical protein